MKALGKLVLVLLIVSLLGYGGLQLSKSRSWQFFGGLVQRVDTDERVVALTFDDGPSANTPAVLEMLDQLGVNATFFLTGNEMEKLPDQTKAIVQAGHELGNHSYTHSRLVLKSLSFVRREVDETDKLIRAAGYEGPIHFRPPGSKKLLVLPYYLKQTDKLTIMCDVEAETDLGFSASAADLARHTVEHAREGSIILMHVMYDSRQEAMNALPAIVTGLREKGYRFVTVSELLELGK